MECAFNSLVVLTIPPSGLISFPEAALWLPPATSLEVKHLISNLRKVPASSSAGGAILDQNRLVSVCNYCRSLRSRIGVSWDATLRDLSMGPIVLIRPSGERSRASPLPAGTKPRLKVDIRAEEAAPFPDVMPSDVNLQLSFFCSWLVLKVQRSIPPPAFTHFLSL